MIRRKSIYQIVCENEENILNNLELETGLPDTNNMNRLIEQSAMDDENTLSLENQQSAQEKKVEKWTSSPYEDPNKEIK